MKKSSFKFLAFVLSFLIVIQGFYAPMSVVAESVVTPSEYLIRNNMGIFNWIALSSSQIVTIDATGTESIIYDVNSMQLTKMIVTISLICVLVFVAVAVVIWQFIKLRRGN